MISDSGYMGLFDLLKLFNIFNLLFQIELMNAVEWPGLHQIFRMADGMSGGKTEIGFTLQHKEL